jgi:hypothetical protein
MRASLFTDVKSVTISSIVELRPLTPSLTTYSCGHVLLDKHFATKKNTVKLFLVACCRIFQLFTIDGLQGR